MPEWLQWIVALLGGGSAVKLFLDWLILRDKLTAGTVGRLWKEIDDLKLTVKDLVNDRFRLYSENSGLKLENAGLKVEVNDLCRRLEVPDRYQVHVIIRASDPIPAPAPAPNNPA